MGRKIQATALIQTKNEEVAIAQCIGGLRDFDEVLVIDSSSSDRTAEIAVAHGVRVVNFEWDGRYPKKKQWQLENVPTRNDWIFFIDADEVPTSALIRELDTLTNDQNALSGYSAFDVRLTYEFAGRQLKFGHRVVKRCFVHRERVEFPEVDDLDIPGMGELEGHYQPTPVGAVGRIRGRLLHSDPDPVRTWFDRHNRYSDWEASLRSRASSAEEVTKLRSRQGRAFARAPFKPVLFFVYGYFFRLGLLDGRAGLDYALALAMYYWQIDLKWREIKRSLPAS